MIMVKWPPRGTTPRGPFDQRVRVFPAGESERAGTFTGSFDGLLRCYLLDGGRVVATVPIQFDDQGHPLDVVWTSTHLERFDKLLFVFEGRTFSHETGEVIVFPNQGVRLALRHLELRDKFGLDVLKR